MYEVRQQTYGTTAGDVMEKVAIRCQRCCKVIAHLTTEQAAYGADATVLCMPCTQPKPYTNWVEIREKRAEKARKTGQKMHRKIRR